MYFAFAVLLFFNVRKSLIVQSVVVKWYSKRIQVFPSAYFFGLYLGNLDEELLRFLKLYFPKEVKAKQKENERLAGLDQLDAVGLGKREKGDCVIQ